MISAPFGPKQVPSAFQQRVSQEVLNGLEGHGVESYIDDFALHDEDFDGFLDKLRDLLQRLRDKDLRLNGKKCVLGADEIEFLGHVVNGKGVRHTEKRKEALQKIQAPVNTKQLRSFLGMAGYFRDSIPGFAKLVKPLTLITSKKVQFSYRDSWEGSAQQQAFEHIKKAIMDSEMLEFVNYDYPLRVRTDASVDGCGAMLFQVIDGREIPVAYLSKTFSETERNWSTMEQETYGVFWAIITWEHYLLGHEFEVETDHKNILWLYRSNVPKILRWRLRLQEFDFSVRHLSGVKNVVADGLSRLVGEPKPQARWACSVTQVLSELQGRRRQVRWAASLNADTSKSEPGKKTFPLSKELLKEIETCHNEIVGHKGIRSVERRMRAAGCTAPYLRDHIQYYIDNCPLCQKISAGQGSIAASLATISVSECGEEWSVDTIGPLPPDEHGNEYVIAAVCGFSRFVFMKAAKSTEALEAAQFLLELAGIFGLPRYFRTDNGPQYDNALVEALLALVGSERYPGIAYRPESNGMIERVNKEIVRHLRFIVHARRVRKYWWKYLPRVMRMLNASFHSSIGTSPCKIVFGGAVDMDRCLVPQKVSGGAKAVIGGITDKKRQMVVADYISHLAEVQKGIAEASDQYQYGVLQKRLEKTPESPTKFEYGQWVGVSWLSNGLKNRPSKLAVTWKGPYLIMGKKEGTHNMYVCQDPTDLVEKEFHSSRLRHYRMGLTEDPKEYMALDTEEDVVEAIVDHNMPGSIKSHWDFKVRWKGCSAEEDSWIPWREAKKLSAMDDYRNLRPELKLPS